MAEHSLASTQVLLYWSSDIALQGNYVPLLFPTRWMTNQPPPPPPPPVQSIATEPAAPVPLAHTIKELYNLVFKVALPKTKAAKTASISIDTLHLLCDLATTAHSTLQDLPSGPQLSDISKQLKSISAH